MMNNYDTRKFDVVIIGGGPAGMMSAGIAAQNGASVALLEKNSKLGQKLLLTGKGRCNITNAEFDNRKLSEKYGKEGKALLSPFSIFAPKDTISFFENLGIKTKIERGQRVFPSSDSAPDVLNALIKFLKKQNVNIIYNTTIADFKQKIDGKISYIITSDNEKIFADNYIICTGGKSYPRLGSTGDGYLWAEKLGHTISKPKPSLTPIKIKESWVKDAQGLSLKNVKLTLWQGSGQAKQNEEKSVECFGEMLFTHFGISGPISLDISKKVGALLDKGEAILRLDLKPALSALELDKRIQKDFQKFQNKLFKNSLNDLLPQKLIPIIINLSKINPDKKVHSITKEERSRLVNLLKNIKMTPKELIGFERAIVTSGGISLKEIDFKTMRSKIVKNLFFAGEIINLDGPCGGFNLQICWTTGYIAGKNAAPKNKKLKKL